jgi:flagellar basal-body rod modification protein FlgD
MTSISSTSASSVAASQATSRKTIAGNFDTFLQLLTTQLQNQNPLDPLDTNQFTQQLVQFSSVEQALKTNDLLASLVSASASDRAAGAAGYLGATITADGSQTSLSNGKAVWNLSATKPAAKATVSILDSSGATVYTKSTPIAAGNGTFSWDGRTDDGSILTGGNYKIKIDAMDAAGQPVTVSTEVSGVVDAVDLTGDVPVLKIGDVSVSLDKIKSLRKSSS